MEPKNTKSNLTGPTELHLSNNPANPLSSNESQMMSMEQPVPSPLYGEGSQLRRQNKPDFQDLT